MQFTNEHVLLLRQKDGGVFIKSGGIHLLYNSRELYTDSTAALAAKRRLLGDFLLS